MLQSHNPKLSYQHNRQHQAPTTDTTYINTPAANANSATRHRHPTLPSSITYANATATVTSATTFDAPPPPLLAHPLAPPRTPVVPPFIFTTSVAVYIASSPLLQYTSRRQHTQSQPDIKLPRIRSPIKLHLKAARDATATQERHRDATAQNVDTSKETKSYCQGAAAVTAKANNVTAVAPTQSAKAPKRHRKQLHH